ncbi:hypothetical protein TNCV_3101111 [Trichonephila clavipes]|nr:hypothetical protein TNCV_3101111 [Trichonephila clavipes]
MWTYSAGSIRETGIPRCHLSATIQDDGNVVDVTAQVAPELQRRMRTGIFLALLPKETDGPASVLSRQFSSATGTTVSSQTVYRRLGHIGLYARRSVR